MSAVIREDLAEPPRFHRKQWEFAAILLALRERGLLDAGRAALSMGAGRERLLYAVARRVGHVEATDLYDVDSGWDGARTADPQGWVLAGAPFPVPAGRLTARRMDMRQLEFPDRSFDFCYSSCAIEHIGERGDFLRHLREVARVLRDGGVYAFTTEFHHGPEVIEHPANFVFPAGYLEELLLDGGLAPEATGDARVAPHKVNFPWPGNLPAMCFAGEGTFSTVVLDEHPHVQILRGACPHTSALFVLTKGAAVPPRIAFPGAAESRDFLAAGVEELRRRLEASRVRLDPVAGGGARGGARVGEADTLLHSDYVWLGGGRRRFLVHLRLDEATADCVVEVRLHRYRTLGRMEVECVAERSVRVGPGPLGLHLEAPVEATHCYALLAHVTRGACRAGEVLLDAEPAGEVQGTNE
jgi:SAM-dependent methyltransferase